MYQLVHQFGLVAFFRATPQQLPGQPIVLWISLLAALITGVAGLLFAYDFAEAIARSLLSLAVPAVALWVLFKVRGIEHRFIQTYSALCGSAAVVYVLAFPLMPYFFDANTDSPVGRWLITLALLINVWALMITAHILRHAMDTGIATAISLSFALMLLTLSVTEALVPGEIDTDASQSALMHDAHTRNIESGVRSGYSLG